MDDVLLEMLQSLRLSGGLFVDAELTAPWCVSSQVHPKDCAPSGPLPRHIIGYHYVSDGAMRLVVEGHPPIVANTGDIVVLVRNDAHLLASDSGPLVPMRDEDLTDAGGSALTHLRFGGGGTLTRLFCGFLGTDAIDSPVLAMLPPILKLSVAEGTTGPWIESSMRFAAQEIAMARAGAIASPGLLARLAEALFMEAVRRFVESQRSADSTSWAGAGSSFASRWAGALRDPTVARALALLHKEPERRWTTEILARAAGLSRSAFADHFVRAVGEPPMRYLTRRRIELASQLLHDTSDAIPVIASLVGYESETAFNRAFHRETGTTPAAFRRARPPR